jgi:hypothetical protein
MPVIPALGRLRQKGGEFKVSLSHMVRSCLKKIPETKQKPLNPFEVSSFERWCLPS